MIVAVAVNYFLRFGTITFLPTPISTETIAWQEVLYYRNSGAGL
jgi:hypothetical protein